MSVPKQYLVPQKQPLKNVSLEKQDIMVMKEAERSIQEAIMDAFPDGVSHEILHRWNELYHLDVIQIIQAAAKSIECVCTIARLMQLYPEVSIVQRCGMEALLSLEFGVNGGLQSIPYYPVLRSIATHAKNNHSDRHIRGLAYLFLNGATHMVYDLNWEASKTSTELAEDVSGLVAVYQAGYFRNQVMFELGMIALEPSSGPLLRKAGVPNLARQLLHSDDYQNLASTTAAELLLLRMHPLIDNLIEDITACILLDLREGHGFVEISTSIVLFLMGAIVDIVHAILAADEGED